MSTSKEKKKKRTPPVVDVEDDEVKVKKKKKKTHRVQDDPKPLQFKIKSIGENVESKSSPIVGYLPSGHNPSKASTNQSIKFYKDSSRSRSKPRMHLVLTPNGNRNLNFVGTSYSGEAATQQMCNYALGVLDKNTGVLKFVPIAANKIFRMEPEVVPESEPQDEAKEGIITKEEDDNMRSVTNSKYTSQKNIRRDVQRANRHQKEDEETGKSLDHKLKNIKMNTKALDADKSTTDATQNIPPYDMAATTPDMAYPLEKIILAGEWDYLKDIFVLAQEGKEVNENDYPSYVCKRFSKLKEIEDDSEKEKIARILTFITHLIKFKDRHSMDGVSSAKHHKIPSILMQKFSLLFGTKNEKRISDEKQNLLISYILVLSLHVDGFMSNILDIAKDLRIDIVTLRAHYGYLGCKLVPQNKVTLATLPLPLKFDTQKRRKRRS